MSKLTSSSQIALVKDQSFMPLLPRLTHNFSANYSFADSVTFLKKLYYIHYQLMKNISGFLISVPEFETKIFLGHAIFLHSEYAKNIRERLLELRVIERHLVETSSWARTICSILLDSESTAIFISKYKTIIKLIASSQQEYISNSDHLLDSPSIKIFKRLEPEWCEMQEWLFKASSAYNNTPEINTDSIIEEIYNMNINDDFSKFKKYLNFKYTRKNMCARDDRFTTFDNTRDYKSTQTELNNLSEYEQATIELLRIQRDEIDAVETFSNILFDINENNPEIAFLLARYIEDEARHAEAGHHGLRLLGFDPFNFPCSIIGINVRTLMPPELAFAQINIFGELNIVNSLKKLSIEAYDNNDSLIAKIFDFIHSDELTHVRKGRKLLKKLPNEYSELTLEERARLMAAKRLVEEGVIDEEYALELTNKQIFDIMGE